MRSFILSGLLLFVLSVPGKSQDVIRASGGTNISIDSVTTGGFVNISGPTIRETSTGQLLEGGTIVLTLPNGYEWNTSLSIMPEAAQGDVGTEDITFTIESVGAQNTDLAITFNSLTASEFTFTVSSASQSAGAGKGPGRLTIEGLQITPTNTNVPDVNTISNTGTTGPAGSNYGDLSKKPGSIDEIQIETKSDGSGQIVSEQDILAGNSITVYSIARDIGDNFISNISLENESDWNLINVTGNLTQSALTPSSSLNSATFSSQSTGSVQIEATHTKGISVPSGTLTVLPRAADQMVINTQPPDTVIAGQSFATQPLIELHDQFGNIVTTDNSTQVTASINTGSGSLQGTVTRQASGGIITYTDLSYKIAETISHSFQSSGFDNVMSSDIVVTPATPSDLVFLQQPTNTAQNATIDPPIELQLLDDFGNNVPTDTVEITISSANSSEAFFHNKADTVLTTDTNGIATFGNLRISNQASVGVVDFMADFPGINTPVTSDAFEIINSGDLANFEITNLSDSDIVDQKAGIEFDIRIRAVDGSGNTFANFENAVTVTADADIQINGSTVTSFTTDNFIQGELDTSLTLTSAGLTQIYAKKSDLDGWSNEFSVTPTNVDFDSTTITANPPEITADGVSTSEITVQLKDQFGNNLISGGETITVETDAGTFSDGSASITAADQNDGTYTATLTSSTTIKTANIQAKNDLNDMIASTQVNFTEGDLDAFIISVPQSSGAPAIQTAGSLFNITVEAVDQYGNRVESYSGTLELSTNSTISSGGSASITNGLLQDHSITFTKSDSTATISAKDPNVYGVTGTSEAFIVEAAGSDAASSQVAANPVVIQNNGSSQSTISITLNDQFGNKIYSDLSADLSISAEQIEQDGTASSGTPDATLSGLSFNSSNSTYTATLTSSTTIEDVEISAFINGNLISQQPIIQIVVPNTWQPSGSPNQRTDWERAANWSLGTVPNEDDFVIIPGGLSDYPDLDLNISIGSLHIELNGQLVLFGGNSISVGGFVQVDGTLDIEDNTNLFIDGSFTGSGTFASGESTQIEIGGDLSLTNFLARTNGTLVRFNGSSQQTLTSPNILAQKLEIYNDVIATSGDLIDTSELLITEGNTFELAQDAGITLDNLTNISGDGHFILNNNTLVVRGDLSLLNIDTSEGTVVFGIRVGESFADYPNLERQQIANLSQMKNAVVNNIEDVRTFEDIIVDGDLTLENGQLIISSGKSLIAPTQVYNNGSLAIRRSINSQGWLMMSSPINSSFDDLFTELTVQGMSGSDYPGRQPNVLYYNETIEGTDNQRWRTPGDVTNAIQDPDSTGRGFFFYVFGDVDSDSDYNDTLPVTLTVSGEEYQHQNSTFNFSSVTYTAEADTGFNMVGNPFAATIDWDDGNWTKQNMDNVIYVWDPETNDYLTWNGIDGSLGNGLIQPFQAFWVKANAANPILTIDKSAKTTGGEFHGKSKKEPAAIEFLLETEGLSKTTHITLSEDGQSNKDPRDAFRLLPFDTQTYLELYTTLDDGTQLTINNLARSFGKEITIPLHVSGFKDGQPINGEYTLSWPKFGDVPDAWSLILEDKRTGQKIDLRKDTFYSFDLSQSKKKAQNNTIENFQLVENSATMAKAKTNSASRFVLHIDPGADGEGIPDEYSLGINYPNPFRNGTKIKYNTPVEGHVKLLIFDILGRKVKTILDERRPADYHEIEWNPPQMASGVYICVMQAGGKQFTKKLTYIK